MTQEEHFAEARRLIRLRLGDGEGGRAAYQCYLLGVLDGLEMAKGSIAAPSPPQGPVSH